MPHGANPTVSTNKTAECRACARQDWESPGESGVGVVRIRPPQERTEDRPRGESCRALPTLWGEAHGLQVAGGPPPGFPCRIPKW